MATTNLGRVKPIHRGVYDPDFLYTPLDIVRYQGGSYFCIKASQGNVPQDGEFFMAIVDGDIRYAQTAGGADANFIEAPQIDGQSLDDRYQQQEAGKGLSANDYTDNEKTKLDGIENGATANDTDAQLRDRATHTGVQPISSVSGLQSELDNKADKAISVVAGTGLSGGGNLSANRTFTLGTPSTLSGGTSNAVTASSHTHAIDATASRTSTSTSTLLNAKAMNDHRTSGDHDSRYARLTGGSAANFTSMPRVGGDPIVESGSNSDGGWTRWADGTQVAFHTFMIVESIAAGKYSEAFSWTAPMGFVGGPSWSGVARGNMDESLSGTSIVVDLRTHDALGGVIRIFNTGHHLVAPAPETYGDTVKAFRVRLNAIGRWK